MLESVPDSGPESSLTLWGESGRMDFRTRPPLEITEVTRRNIIDALIMEFPDFHGRIDLVTFLGRVWNLKEMPSTDRRYRDLDGDMRQHISWGDYGYDDAGLLYAKLDVIRASDETFGAFLTQTLHPVVQSDPARIADLLTLFNRHLAADGFVVVQSGQLSGRPLYTMTKIGSPMALEAEHFDVSLSYAGEQHAYVEEVAGILRDAGVSVFFAPLPRGAPLG